MADFWLMIWQENIEQVVMLTNIMEGTKVNKYHTLSVLVDFIDSNFYYSFTYKCVYINSGNASNIGQTYKHLWSVVVSQ